MEIIGLPNVRRCRPSHRQSVHTVSRSRNVHSRSLRRRFFSGLVGHENTFDVLVESRRTQVVWAGCYIPDPSKATQMSLPRIEVSIRPTNTPGVTKAHADVTVILPSGEIHLIGFAIVKQPGKKAFVGFPQNRGRDKYFPVVKATGDIEEQITQSILRAYKKDDQWGDE
jgi:DNA-binding cell septation regulator SpoVG